MRAWRVGALGEPRDVLELSAVAALGEPGPGLLRLQVSAAGIGRPDLFMCQGSYALTPPLPFTPGQEAVGVVTAVGEGALARVGDRRMAVTAFFAGHGSFAEECLALDDFALPVPEGMSDAEAAGFLIPFHTAYVGLVRRAGLRAGENLLVLGAAGGTGSAALQLGAALGARVIASAGGPEKGAFCSGLGADVVVDYRSQDIAEAVREATAGAGADVVYDAVGGEAFRAATHCIAHEGRLLVVGFGSGQWGQPSAAHLVTHNYSLLGVMPGGYDRAFKEAAQSVLAEHWRAGRLRVPLSDVVDFEALPTALEELAAGSVTGKLALAVATRPG